MIQAIKNITPDFIKRLYRVFFPITENHGWFGSYSDWASALKNSLGYDNTVILEKVKASVLKVKNGEAVYERDSVLFDTIEYSQPLLDAFIAISKENNNELHVVDFGGSLGSSYFQNRSFLSDVKKLQWSIVEQKHFVDCGKETIEGEQLKFYYTIEETLLRAKANVLFLSSVVQYFEKPYELIEKCLNYNFDYIIIDRTAFIESESERITVQVVPESIYKASYPAWFFNEKKFLKTFLAKYSLVNEFDSKVSHPIRLKDNKAVYWKGFILKKK